MDRLVTVTLHGVASLEGAHRLVLIASIDEMGWDGMRNTWISPFYISTATWHKREGAHSSGER
jgi:hypothetical protein